MEISFLNARLVRLLIFLVLVSFMTAEPLYHYGRVGMRDWRMFDGAGWGVVDARFTQVLDDGNEVVLDRLKLLKKKYKNQTLQERERNNVWLIQEKRGGELDIAKQLCGILGPDAKIKIYSRISRPEGWSPSLNGKIVNCLEK